MSNLLFWGLTASPYQLKMQSLADYAEVPWQRFPAQARPPQAITTIIRLKLACTLRTVKRFPQYVRGMDEYPEVPFYTLDGKQFYYDSTGLALHLDAMELSPQTLLPQAAATRFLCQLIDDAFDEFGLYMVHHNRWITSAETNVMASMTVKEMNPLLPPFMRKGMRGKLAERQVRRCPYLFSVAPTAYECGMPPELTPCAREGFPSTHTLLDAAWRRYLAAIEHILEQQPFLLGERFTLADASAYGQLGMNLVDGLAAELLQELAPRTFRWLCMIRDGKHRGSSGKLVTTETLMPLLQCIAETYIPLMQQNAVAYENAVTGGQRLFNEAAFDRGEALYDGALMDLPFRSVVKSFQVVSWRELCAQWQGLDNDTRQGLAAQYPLLEDSQFTGKDARPEAGTGIDQAALD
ncbi:MAG: glutathione S-transferase C-terminal domain-containing protein [Halioglobus sp.]